MARTRHIFSRRALLKGTAATAATAVAVDMLYGCKSSNSTDAASSSVVADDSSGTDVLEEYTYDESTVDAASTWSLPLGCVLHPAEGTWIPVTAAGAKASPLITGSALDTSSGTLKTVIAQPISSGSNMEIYDARCSDSAYAWVEINILNRSWKLYGQAFSDGAVTGTASLLWEADSNWDPPALAVSGSKVIWQVQPSTSGSSTKESSHCYLWKTGDSSAKAVIESSGRFGCDISISDGNAILAPRVNASSGTYYGITAYSLSDDMGTVTDQLVLPQSVKPMSAQRLAIQSFSSPLAPIPERSPLMSAANTGTPALLICSVMSCNVLVLPVPVAPATRPCRFSMDRESLIRVSGCGCPSTISTPRSMDGLSNV